MEEIKGFVITLVTMLILISAIELISPENSMKKYIKFVLGCILIAVMISPLINFLGDGEELLVNKEQKILVYCRSGNRSKKAADLLVEMGYTNVYDFGGIKDWPYEIVK